MLGYKSREFNAGDRVRVYRNLNNGLFSLVAMSGPHKGKVVAHVGYVQLRAQDTGTMVKISLAGQARARRQGQRNVHAWIDGYLVSFGMNYTGSLPEGDKRVSYVPFCHDGFVYCSDGRSWDGCAASVLLACGQCFVFV